LEETISQRQAIVGLRNRPRLHLRELGGQAIGHDPRLVARTVLHDENLKIAIISAQAFDHPPNRGIEKFLFLVGREHHRDRRRRRHGEKRSR
jgi:hypothetical protein